MVQGKEALFPYPALPVELNTYSISIGPNKTYVSSFTQGNEVFSFRNVMSDYRYRGVDIWLDTLNKTPQSI